MSATVNTTAPGAASARTVTAPPSRQASQAFSSRFTSACSIRRASPLIAGNPAATSRDSGTPAFANRCSTSDTAASMAWPGGMRCAAGKSPRASPSRPRITSSMRRTCDWMASRPRRVRSSAARGRSCSARAAITLSGVAISWATPIASVPRAATRLARCRRWSALCCSSDIASSRASTSSLRCSRMVSPPKTTTSTAAPATLPINRRLAARSRSRSRWAVATAAISQGPAAVSTRANPASAVRAGSPSAAASGRLRRVTASPRVNAASSGGQASRPEALTANDASPRRRTRMAVPVGRGTAWTSVTSAVSDIPPLAEICRIAASARARLACSPAKSASARASSRWASKLARTATAPTAAIMAAIRASRLEPFIAAADIIRSPAADRRDPTSRNGC